MSLHPDGTKDKVSTPLNFESLEFIERTPCPDHLLVRPWIIDKIDQSFGYDNSPETMIEHVNPLLNSSVHIPYQGPYINPEIFIENIPS